jgi:hypothetical protein
VTPKEIAAYLAAGLSLLTGGGAALSNYRDTTMCREAYMDMTHRYAELVHILVEEDHQP